MAMGLKKRVGESFGNLEKPLLAIDSLFQLCLETVRWANLRVEKEKVLGNMESFIYLFTDKYVTTYIIQRILKLFPEFQCM